jgi:hypothetical protein
MRSHNGLAFTAAVLFTACGGAGGRPADPEFSEAAPEFDGVSLELSDNDTAEGRSDGQGLESTPPPLLGAGREAIRRLNEIVRGLHQRIAELLADHPDVRTGTTHVWEKVIGDVSYRFIMRKAAPNRFGWAGQVKKASDPEEAYQLVMGGVIVRDPNLPARRGRGKLGIDLDKWGAVETHVKARGKVFIGFAHGRENVKVLVYALAGFTPDPAEHAAIDAAFSGFRGPLGGRHVRLFLHANLPGSETDAQEKLAMYARWLPGVGGRADAVAFAGDVPEDHLFIANACWNAQEQQGFYILRDCEKGEGTVSCTTKRTEGEPSNCALGLRDEMRPHDDPEDPTTGDAPPETPEDAPAGMPDGSGRY